MSRSQNRTINVTKAINLGHLPTFLSFAQRHLEKEQANGATGREFQIPVDMLRMSLSDPSLLAEVDSVTLTYKAK